MLTPILPHPRQVSVAVSDFPRFFSWFGGFFLLLLTNCR